MSHTTVLLVDDERDTRELVDRNLSRDGYRVLAVGTAEEALVAARRDRPHLIILDLMLPGVDGLDLCRVLKRDPETRHIPIVILTAKGSEADIVAGLELGADDYVTKPFSPRVLLARIRAILRRGATQPDAESDTVVLHNMTIHPRRHQLLVGDRPVELTAMEFRVLLLLARHPGCVLTRQQIVDAVRGDDDSRLPDGNNVIDCSIRSVDFHIVRLRRKLGCRGACIETVRGKGYRMKEAWP